MIDGPSQPSKPGDKKRKIEDYHVEDAMRTILKAEEHKQDDELMEHVHKKLGKQKKAIDSIAALKKRRSELQEEQDEK